MADYVILLHGILRTSKHMRSMARFLSANGYEVHNLKYPSTSYGLAQLSDMVFQNMSERLVQPKPVHIVGYSMGGLLLRVLLSRHQVLSLGRVVQLASPNKGSEVADFWQHNWLYKKLYGPAGQQLITDQSAIKDLFGPIDYELGVIAGTASIDPFSSRLISGVNDGKVSLESTKVDGMKAHCTVHATHTFFPQNKKVQQLTHNFLQYGKF